MPSLHSDRRSIVERGCDKPWEVVTVRASGEEDSARHVLEVVVLWGSTILAVRHLGRNGEIVVGDFPGSIARLPEAVLGSAHATVAKASEGSFTVIAPTHALVKVNGGEVHMKAARVFHVTGEERVSLLLGDFEIRLAVLPEAEEVPKAPLFDRLRDGGVGYMAAAGLAHGALISAFAFQSADLNGDDESAEARSRRLSAIRQYLQASAEPERAFEKAASEAQPASPAPGGGARAKGAEGKLGREGVTARDRRYGIAGRADETDPRPSRERAIAEAREFGAIGILATLSHDAAGPLAPWGDAIARGVDPKSALGAMFGATIGESGGQGGLGLSGVGEGGGGTFEGIGLDAIGALGHWTGPPGTGPGGFGSCQGERCGKGLRAHRPRGPVLREAGKTEVTGRLPPELIQRVVRQNFGRFRNCYEAGLRTNPSLEGRVVTRFVVDRSGKVSHATDGGSDMADKAVVGCVTRAFTALSFPEVEGGIVRIVYPIMFTPG